MWSSASWATSRDLNSTFPTTWLFMCPALRTRCRSDLKTLMSGENHHPVPHVVVGVVGDVKRFELDIPDHMAVYVPCAQDPLPFRSQNPDVRRESSPSPTCGRRRRGRRQEI